MARRQNKAERQARLATPKAAPPPLTRDQLYALAREHAVPGASKLTKDQLIGALAQLDIPLVAPVARTAPEPGSKEAAELEARRIAQAAEVHQARLTDAHAPQAEESRVKRLKLAGVEQAALKEWQLGGEQGPRPDTPNYDAIAAQYVSGGAKAAKRQRKFTMRSGDVKVRGGHSARGREALAARKALGKVPPLGTLMTDAALDKLIVEVHAAHPESSWLDEYRYARFVEQRGITRGRWEKAWARLFPPGAEAAPAEDEPDEDPVIENPDAEAVAEALGAEVISVTPKATAKKVTAKKQPARKQPAAKKQPAKKVPASKKQVTPRFKGKR